MIKNDSGEKGIALLFTLGMLSLILIMALAFTATSMVEMKSSVNNANRAVARLLAKSTINKVAGLVQFYENVYFSHTQSGDPNYGHSDWLCKLDCDDIFTWDSSYASSVNWEYIKADDGSGTDKIVARYAYVVLPGGGVDPGDMVKGGIDESSSVTVEQRPGVEMNELNIGAFYESVYNRSTLVNKFNYSGTGTGVYTGAWLSFTNLFTQTGFGNYDSHRAFKTMLQRFCVIDAPNDDEAFWLDESGSGTVGDKDIDTANDSLNELYHRFNIARTGATACPTWDATTIDNLTGVSPAFPTAADEFNSADANYDGYCIPWLKNWSESAGGWSSSTVKAKQIAANLKDYCDFDDSSRDGSSSQPFNEKATNDWGGVDTTPPTYVGNDLTAYINEVHIRFDAVPVTYTAGTDTYSWGDGLLKFKVELHNMYNTSVYGTDKPYMLLPNIRIFYDIEMQVKIDGTVRETQRISGTKTPALAAGNIGPNAYKISNVTGADVAFSTLDGSVSGLGTGLSEEVEAIIHDLKIYVVRTGTLELQDYADICDSYTATGIENAGTYKHQFFRVNDPRHNQFASLWTASGTGSLSSDYLSGSTNPECRPAASGDQDNQGSADEAQDISTDYIRNAPMQSPWELGCIHRANTWETLNLKAYNGTAGSLKTGGGGAYADGDANILDQIKMCATNTSAKKVPVKTQAVELLQALFRGITVGNDYSAPGTITSTRQITATEAGNLADAFLAGNGTLRSRAELASIAELSSSSFEQYGSADVSLDNDAKKEEIIGKIVNLTENVKDDYFTVVAMAQSIKDIGGGVAINNDLNYNGAIDSSFSESGRDIDGDGETNTTGLSETTTNCQFGVYDQFADQILATQKVVAQIYRDPNTGACTILKFEYYD